MIDKVIRYLENEMDKTNNAIEWYKLSVCKDRAVALKTSNKVERTGDE